MVKRMCDNGIDCWHEPPYTEEEALEIYAGVSARGGLTILHGPRPGVPPQLPPKAPPPPATKPNRP